MAESVFSDGWQGRLRRLRDSSSGGGGTLWQRRRQQRQQRLHSGRGEVTAFPATPAPPAVVSEPPQRPRKQAVLGDRFGRSNSCCCDYFGERSPVASKQARRLPSAQSGEGEKAEGRQRLGRPTPGVLRQLGLLFEGPPASSRVGHRASEKCQHEGAGRLERSASLPQPHTPHAPLLHFEALVRAARSSDGSSDESVDGAFRISERLARLTRRLVGSSTKNTPAAGAKDLPLLDCQASAASPPPPLSAVSTFDGATFVPDDERDERTRHQQWRRQASRMAVRRNVTLALSLAPQHQHQQVGAFSVPTLSPACTLLNSEAVTASATACGSALASPLLHAASFDVLGDFPLRTAPAGAASPSARDMLWRLAGVRQDSPPEPLHADVHEEWGLFISDCLKALSSTSAVVPDAGSDTGSQFDTAAVVPDGQALPRRWFSKLGRHEHERFHALLAKGVPAEFRRQVWMEGADALELEPFQCPTSQAVAEEIELDLVRGDYEAEAELRLVLHGFVAARADVGYCQGMDRVADGLLRAGLCAPDAAAMLRAIVGGVVPAGVYRAPMTLLQTDQQVLGALVARRLPRLSRHLHTLGVALAPVTVSWFLTLFVDALPEPHRLRVWDVLFVRGYAAVFQAALAILSACRCHLLRCTTPAAAYTLLQDVRALAAGVDTDEFAQRAFAGPCAVSMAEIDEVRRQEISNDH
ncbi:hypothetical protein GGF46_004950 [Coemansia sp. RSA 552]|nr:hypothetical protein GGF46_004950 [Coemansia sp. RSA 552]